MKSFYKILFFTVIVLTFVGISTTFGQETVTDTTALEKTISKKQEHFYDSLKYKANQRKLTRMMYDFLISSPPSYVDKKVITADYYSHLEGKIISEIHIKPLDVFGPTFEDTARTASSWLEKTANAIHTKSNLKSIQKLLLFKVGDTVDSELIYENERLIRSLPYIKEIRFILEQDSIYEGLVNVTVLTKDRFSFGATGEVDGIKSAALGVYNQNMFGIGHEISLSFLGHVNKQPYLGLETYYKIKNIKGKFIDMTLGYLNAYKSEGFQFDFNKPFITPSVKWGYGATALRMYRTNQIFDENPIITELPLNLFYYEGWGGRSFQIKKEQPENAQIVISGAINSVRFFERPQPDFENHQYFANNTFLLGGITFTQRRFVKDQLIYSYGITEDIPEGFKNEIVYGYDINEFGNRHYFHLLLSNGNLLINQKGYLYMEGNIGGYFNRLGYQQGQINAKVNFISRQFNAGRKRFRLFTKVDYTVGLKRYDIEVLNLQHSIRGFSSREAVGKQRLTLNLEHVLFLRKELYNFNIALFSFADIGVIGTNKKFILAQNYYSGIGLGLRLHNENLVFKTFQLRLAFYPFHPGDMDFVGFVLDEQSKGRFYSFEPMKPEPIIFN